MKKTFLIISILVLSTGMWAQHGTDHIPVPDASVYSGNGTGEVKKFSEAKENVLFPGLNAVSGNLFLELNEFTWNVLGTHRDFNLYYNSLSNDDLNMGKGWRTDFSQRLRIIDRQHYLFVNEDGKETSYTKKFNVPLALSPGRLDTLFLMSGESFVMKRFNKERLYFNSMGRIFKMQNQTGIYYFLYSGKNELSRIIDPVGREIRFDYNQNALLSAINFFNSYILTFEYNAENQLIRVSDNIGAVRMFVYNSEGLLKFYKDSNTSVFQYEYAKNQKLKKVILSDQRELKIAYKSILGLLPLNRTTLQLDSESKTVHWTSKSWKIKDEEGTLLKKKWNGHGQLIRQYKRGSKPEIMEYSKNHLLSERNKGSFQENYTYNEEGLLLSKTNNRQCNQKFVYDENKQLSGIIDQVKLSITKIKRNHWGLPVQIDEDKNKILVYYDSLGNVSKIKYPAGVEYLKFDVSGNLEEYSDTLGNRLSAGYNLKNQMTWLKVSVDWKIRFNYNEAGRLSGIIYPGGQEVIFRYNALNQLVQEESNGKTFYFYYNEEGLPILPSNFDFASSIRFEEEAELKNPDLLALETYPLYKMFTDIRKGKTRIPFITKDLENVSGVQPEKKVVYYIDLEME